MVHDAHLRVRPGQLVGNVGSRVDAAVIHDDDLEIRRQTFGRLEGGDHEAGDGPAVVVRRKEDRQPRLARLTHQVAVKITACAT